MENEFLIKMLEKHFSDDTERFDKLQELATLNGTHLSYFNKNLEEVKKILEKQNETSENSQRTLTDHIKRVEPMISAYEKDNEFNKILGNKTKKWATRVGAVATLIGALYVIRSFIISLLK